MFRCSLTFLLVLMSAALCRAIAGQERPIQFEKDIVYGKAGGVELKLDLARPASGKGPFPAVVWLHGGGWQAGSKSDNRVAIRKLAEQGYVAASVEYRFAPRFPFPAQIEDAKCAVRYLRAHARELNLNPERIGACGESAGGQLALLLGLMDSKDGLEGTGGHPEQSSKVQAVVSFVSATDFRKLRKAPREAEEAVRGYYGGKGLDQVMTEFLGTLDPQAPVMRQVSPVTYVNTGDPPVLTFYGDKDPFVAVEQGEFLDAALKQAGVETQMVIVKGGGHGWTGKDKERTDRLTLGFLDRHLKTTRKENAPPPGGICR
jgi:acetyl esterase/lipase